MPTKQHVLERKAFNRRARWEVLRYTREMRRDKDFNRQARKDLRERVWSSLLALWAADSAQSRR